MHENFAVSRSIPKKIKMPRKPSREIKMSRKIIFLVNREIKMDEKFGFFHCETKIPIFSVCSTFFKRNIVENLAKTTPIFLSVIMNYNKFLKNPIFFLSIFRNRDIKMPWNILFPLEREIKMQETEFFWKKKKKKKQNLNKKKK